jgi:hypothetical protein
MLQLRHDNPEFFFQPFRYQAPMAGVSAPDSELPTGGRFYAPAAAGSVAAHSGCRQLHEISTVPAASWQ